MTYIAPTAFASKYTCPHCSAISKQSWDSRTSKFSDYGQRSAHPLRVAFCDHCSEYSLWHNNSMVFPDNGMAPPPNPDMPPTVHKYYSEAASIAQKSPRAAAGLLRLAIQVLCHELGGAGKNINDDIGVLVQKGLPSTVQQSLDIVRVTGNSAVHPGQIDTDDVQVVGALFALLNVIVEYMISLPSRVGSLYSSLPAGALDQIKKRDETSN